MYKNMCLTMHQEMSMSISMLIKARFRTNVCQTRTDERGSAAAREVRG
jgi:hypothetical protein